MSMIDVNEVRTRLMVALGPDGSSSYFSTLKSWFCMKITREEFDRHARSILVKENLPLHNEFLLAIVTKCQSLCQPATYVHPGVNKRKPMNSTELERKPSLVAQRKLNPVKVGKPEVKTVARKVTPKNKPQTVSFENRFQPMEPVAMLKAATRPSPIENPQIRFCSRDKTLPDAGLVHGRILVASWDAGLKNGCNDKATKLVLEATQQFMRDLIVAIITNRKGYRLRENKVIHSVGQPTINPWLHNSWAIHDSTSNSYSTEICQSSQPPHVPSIPVSSQKAERDSAFYLACTTDQVTSLKPISVLDVFLTLQVKKSVIPIHTVHAVNMERLSQRLYHPSPASN